MMRLDFSGRQERPFYAVLFGLVILVFVVDLAVPLGTAVWIIYLVPAVLSYLAWRQQIPLLVAIAITALVAIGFAVDRSGIDRSGLERLHREHGLLCLGQAVSQRAHAGSERREQGHAR